MQKYNIPLVDILEVAEFLMKNTFFQFNKSYYKQIYGTPMGSPVSPRFADIVMQDLENDCLELLDFKPIIYYRYVDDILMIVPEDKIDHVVQTFNSYNPKLQFTCEQESNDSISFLEIRITRQVNQLITDWYHKPTFSGRFLNYNSSHPVIHKKGMIFSLVDKAIQLSDNCFHHKNLQLVRKFLINNDYPVKFVDLHIKNRVKVLVKKKRLESTIILNNSNLLSSTLLNATLVDDDINNNNNNNNSNNNNNHSTIIDNNSHTKSNRGKKKFSSTFCMPYIPHLFENLAKKMAKYNIRTVPNITNSLGRLIKRGKDRTELTDRTNVVYKFFCDNNDCKASYVGETKRHVGVRIKEHIRDSKNETKDEKLVVNKHMKDYKHTFDFDNFTILDSNVDNWHKRTLSEMIHINLQVNGINKKDDKKELNSCYAPLIRKMKRNI